jgi:hypothetical protein
MQATEDKVKFNANYNKRSKRKDRIMLASNPYQRFYFQTKSMSTDMVELEEYPGQHLLQKQKNMSCGKMDDEQKFNTATTLVYTGEDAIQECKGSSIGFQWMKSGMYLHNPSAIWQHFGSTL